MTTTRRCRAEDLNSHLESGGVVQVTTYTRSTVYDSKRHAGMFFEKDGDLCVRRGRSFDRLSMGEGLLVSIRLGRYVNR